MSLRKSSRPRRAARQLRLEPLERRALLATLSLVDTELTISLTGGEHDLVLSGSQGNYALTINGNPVSSSDLTDGSVASITINGNNSGNNLDASGVADRGVTINGGSGSDFITGTGFDDVLNGDSGNDVINAGAGNDTITGGAGADSMDGQEGNDTYNIADSDATGDTYVDSGTSNMDRIVNTGGTLMLKFLTPTGDGANYSGIETFNGGGNVIEGSSGGNVLDFSGFGVTTGVSAVNTFSGSDVINLSTADWAVTIDAGSGNDTVIGTFFGDIIYGGDGNDTIYGGDGNDTITGGAGADFMDGQAGSDTYKIADADANGDTFADSGFGNNDVIQNTGGTLTLKNLSPTGDDANYSGIETFLGLGNAIEGTNSGNVLDFSGLTYVDGITSITTFGGKDYIDVSTLANGVTIDAGAGQDTIIGTQFGDVIFGGDGSDTISGGAGNDAITGGAGADIMDGQEGSDTYYIAGTDALRDAFLDSGSGNNDVIQNTGGTLTLRNLSPTGETANYSGIETFLGMGNVIEGSSSGNVLDFTGFTFVDGITSITTFGGKDYIDVSTLANGVTVDAGAGSDTIIGTQFGDVLYGGDGNDFIYGGEGPDTITGGAGADFMNGQGLNDTYYIAGSDATGDTFADSGSSGNDTIAIVAGGDALMLKSFAPTGTTTTYAGIESFYGTNHAIVGSDGGNVINFSGFVFADGITSITTFSGNDYINVSTLANGVSVDAGANNDTIIGSAYSDVLFGGDGNDTINGGDGNDKLIGGAGVDDLYGEAGDDWLYGYLEGDAVDGKVDTLDGGADNDSAPDVEALLDILIDVEN